MTTHRIALLAASVAALMTLQPAAYAVDGVSVGSRWRDGADTRLAADRFGSALAGIGYATTTDVNGRASDTVWNDGQRAAAMGIFSHANAGFMATGYSTAGDEYLAGGLPTDVVSTFDRTRFVTEYKPALDVDDLKLMVFGGCHTARASADLGDLDEAATSRGVDSTIAFTAAVEAPSTAAGTPMADTNYSGNYFWSRVSTNLSQGTTIETALKRALSDLIAKEGGAGSGYQTYRIEGASPTPAATRLTPPSSGGIDVPTGVTAAGTAPYRLTDLTRTASREVSGPDGRLREVSTSEGVSLRERPDGTLVDLTAPSSTAGPITLTIAEAEARARGFVGAQLGSLDRSWTRIDSRSVSHLPGQEVAGFSWRTTLDGVPGPQAVTVEVDRRTGAVTYYAMSSADPTRTSFLVPRDRAVAAARTASGLHRPEVTSVTRDVWHRARYTVRLERGHVRKVVVVDAGSGRVLRTMAA